MLKEEIEKMPSLPEGWSYGFTNYFGFSGGGSYEIRVQKRPEDILPGSGSNRVVAWVVPGPPHKKDKGHFARVYTGFNSSVDIELPATDDITAHVAVVVEKIIGTKAHLRTGAF